MHSVLFSIGGFAVHSYGLMLAVSFLFGIWLAGIRAKSTGLDAEVIPDLGFWLIIASIIGARAYYVVLHFNEFSSDITTTFNPFAGGQIGIGGLVMYGGFIGAFVAGLIFFRIKKLPFLPYADAVAPSFAIGEGITRIGCFLNGCCYGKPTHSHFGVTFPLDSPAGYFQVQMHADKLFPSQLVLSAGGITIGVLVILLTLRKWFPGFAFYVTIAYTCVSPDSLNAISVEQFLIRDNG